MNNVSVQLFSIGMLFTQGMSCQILIHIKFNVISFCSIPIIFIKWINYLFIDIIFKIFLALFNVKKNACCKKVEVWT